MKQTLLGVVLSITGSLLILVLFTMASHALTGRRFYYNGGVSLAPGVYACRPVAPDAPLRTGALVQLVPTPEERTIVQRLAPTELRTEFWMKRVVAHTGQTVCLQGDTVMVDGVVLAHRPLLREYPLLTRDGCWTIAPTDVFALGTHPRSFDARYAGPWARTAVHGTCEALWTWEAQP